MTHPLPFYCRVSLLEGENGPAHFPPSLFHCVSITCNSYLAILWASMHIVDDCYITLVHILVDVLNNCIGPIQWNTHRNHERTYLTGYSEGGEAKASPVGRLCSVKDHFILTKVDLFYVIIQNICLLFFSNTVSSPLSAAHLLFFYSIFPSTAAVAWERLLL